MTSLPLNQEKNPLSADHTSAILEVRSLEVSFTGFKAVNGLDLTVSKGETRVLIGANGAGKTTTMDLISGKTKSTGGAVYFKDVNITNWSPHKISRIGIGRKFQVPSVFKELTVAENIRVALCPNPGLFSAISHWIWDRDIAHIEDILNQVGLLDVRFRQAKYLSHGQTQWLEIGMVLAQDPDLILLDEPTAGMTIQETGRTAEIINSLKGKHTILVVEHDMTFVRDISHIITVMHQGKKLAEGTVEQIEKDAKVIEAYLGSGGITHA